MSRTPTAGTGEVATRRGRLLQFCDLAGRFFRVAPTLPASNFGNLESRVQNSPVVGRRAAFRVVIAQCAVAAMVASGFLLQSPRAALSAAIGGGAVVLGSALMAWRSFGGGVHGGMVALARLFGGLALKWLVIVAALYIALARLGLPPLPLIAGVGAALAAFVLAGLVPAGQPTTFRKS